MIKSSGETTYILNNISILILLKTTDYYYFSNSVCQIVNIYSVCSNSLLSNLS